MLEYKLQLDEVVAITENMLESAKATKWDDVVMFENDRQKYLTAMEKYAPMNIGENEENLIAEKIQYIIMLNHRILLLSSDEKVACFKQFSESKNSQKAFSAYSFV